MKSKQIAIQIHLSSKPAEDNITLLKEIILHLDQAPTLQTEIRTFRLEYAVAEDVATKLEEIITGDSIQGGGRRSFDREDILEMMTYRRNRGNTDDIFQGIVGLVNISYDDRLNIVIISSDPRNFTIIEDIIETLDQKQTENEFKMYLLEFADATTLKEQLTELFEGEDTGSDSGYRYWWDRDSRSSDQDTGFGVQGTVHIVEYIRLNALLISTSANNFPMIDGLIKQLDVNLPGQEWGSRIFYLKYADAENIANLINTHYQGNQDDFSGGDSYYYYRYYLPRRQTTPQAQGALAGNVAAQPLASHNALIVSTGTKTVTLNLLKTLLKNLIYRHLKQWQKLLKLFVLNMQRRILLLKCLNKSGKKYRTRMKGSALVDFLDQDLVKKNQQTSILSSVR